VHSAQEQRRDHFAMVSTRPPIAAQHVISVFRRPSLSTPAYASGIIGQPFAPPPAQHGRRKLKTLYGGHAACLFPVRPPPPSQWPTCDAPDAT
jgi:hypothetical protein